MTFIEFGPIAYYAGFPSLSALFYLFHLFTLLQFPDFPVILILSILLIFVVFSFKGKAIVSDEIDWGLDLAQQILGFLLTLSPIGSEADAMYSFSATLLNLVQANSQPGHKHLYLPHVHLRLFVILLLWLGGSHFLQLLVASKSCWIYLG